jgi:hypothetical protein
MTRWGSTRIPLVAGFVLVALGITPTQAGAATGNAFLSVLHGLPKFTADVYVNGKLPLPAVLRPPRVSARRRRGTGEPDPKPWPRTLAPLTPSRFGAEDVTAAVEVRR